MNQILRGCGDMHGTLVHGHYQVGSSGLQIYMEAESDTGWQPGQLADEAYQERLAKKLRELGVRRAFIPTASQMSGIIFPPKKFTEETVLPHGITVLRPGFDPGSGKQYGCEGTYLIERGDAFVVERMGGCALLVVPELRCMAHAGRDSLIDRRVINGLRGSRADMSVIQGMARRPAFIGKHVQQLSLYSFFEVPTEDFVHSSDHPKYGEYNDRMEMYIEMIHGTGIMYDVNDKRCLDLSRLICKQGERHGFSPISVANHRIPSGGNIGYPSHPNPEFRDRRSLVVGFLPA